MEAGDVVAIDSTLKAGVKKSEKTYDSNTLGIISTNPGLTIGDTNGEGLKPVLVALAGRVPVKVSLENGSISPGDLLTPSSTAGIAMKATKAGVIIGQSLTNYDGSQPAYVMAFIKSGYSNGSKLAQIQGLSLSAEDVERTKEQQTLAYLVSNRAQLVESDNISEVYTDRLTAALEIITPKLYSDEIDVRDLVASGLKVTGQSMFLGDVEFTFTPLFNSDTAGFAVINQGDTEVNINFGKEYLVSPVVNASPIWNADQSTLDVMKQLGTYILPKQDYIIVNANTKGFSIVLDKPAATDLKFSWMALAVKDVKTVLSANTSIFSPTPFSVATNLPIPTTTASPSATPVVTLTPTPTAIPQSSPGVPVDNTNTQTQTLTILSSELGYVRLRDLPSVDGVELNQIPNGTILTYISQDNGWYKVTYNEQVGWVNGMYVSLN